MSAIFVPGFANRPIEIGRSTSRWMSRSLSNASVSMVTETEPSIEFSIGMNPISHVPGSTAAITSGTPTIGDALTRGEVVLGEERFLGEGPRGAEERDGRHDGAS